MNKPSISSIFSELSKLDEDTFPPVEKWDPPLCENVEMRIDRSGRWFFMNSPIGRERMVNLFSRVLRLDSDGFYYPVFVSQGENAIYLLYFYRYLIKPC